MIKRYYILICAMILLLLCTACEDKITLPVEQPDGTFMWNGLQLIREELGYGGFFAEITVPENVITTKDNTLTMLLRSRSSGTYEYGTNEFIQVNLDGVWYTLMQKVSQSEDSIILEGFDSPDPVVEYTIDFSGIGELPTGKYRLVETFYDRENKDESFSFAYFWVIKPGGKRPPESETTGKARKEDIILTVSSPYEARRDITDRDSWFCMFAENLSGKLYYTDTGTPILEMKNNGKWETIDYYHANVGLLSGWILNRYEVFFKEFPMPGHYRIRVPMYTDDRSEIEAECEFDILAYEDAPEPEWEVSRLIPSPYDASKQSTGIIMSVANPVLNENNTDLDITLTADKLYTYGESYKTEVLLDGKWYRVPFANGIFNQPMYIVDQTDNEYSRRNFSCSPLDTCGILPVGQYRIIKEFTVSEFDSSEDTYTVIAHEFAIAEFTLENLFETEPFFIGSADE